MIIWNNKYYYIGNSKYNDNNNGNNEIKEMTKVASGYKKLSITI